MDESLNVSECVCGGAMLPKTDTLIKNVRGKEIELNGIPYYQCSTCGEITFRNEDNIAVRMALAYQQDVTCLARMEQIFK